MNIAAHLIVSGVFATIAGEEDVDLNARGMLLTQLHAGDTCDLIVLAAGAGDVSTMLQHLRNHPNEVYIIYMPLILICVWICACTHTHTHTHTHTVHNDSSITGFFCACTLMPSVLCHYEQVNRMVDGRAAVHEACREGYVSILKALLDYNPDLDLMVCVLLQQK